MNAFQTMVINTMKRSLGPASTDIANQVCKDMGITITDLSHTHMEKFGELLNDRISKYLGDSKAKFLVGVLKRFKESEIGR